MYSNLKSVLYQKNINIKQYAEFLGVSEKTVQNKLHGITDFTYLEFKKPVHCFYPSIMLIFCLDLMKMISCLRMKPKELNF